MFLRKEHIYYKKYDLKNMEIIDTLKYEGDIRTLVWKHPSEDFNNMTQLIVHESQEAVFFLNGKALDLFGPGRFTLETQNIPLIGKEIKNISKDNPFHCEVYFINKSEQMAIKWGLDSKVEFIEPNYSFPIAIGVSGEMSIQVNDSRKLITKLVGTETLLDQDKLTLYFKSIVTTNVKTNISKIIKSKKINIFEIDEYLVEISNSLKEIIDLNFSEYGVSLKLFLITTILKPEGDSQYEKFKELHYRKFTDIQEAKLNQEVDVINAETAAKKTIIESEAISKKRRQEGYSYQEERAFDVSEKMAQNESIGQYSNLGIGLGTMMGVGQTVGGMVTNSIQNTNIEKKCLSCGFKLENSQVFCPNCGHKVNNNCTNCGYTFNVADNFCPQCGTKRG